MKHLIMGTAGHIDHGKTALVKALTGIDCDTHKEEKRRGITINLGFAHLSLDNGDTVGIVDVPGHRDFVNTMVSGASGIDFALLAIAADEGVMPQTREHVQIMEILGIKKGIVALTKIDRVEAGKVAAVRDETAKFAEGTFLEGCPVVNVSSITGEGIEQLKRVIGRVAREVSERPSGSAFRMYIDRIFSVSGFGTVVTGSVISGTLPADDTVFLLPGAKRLRVRRLERYGERVTKVNAGDRTSCNLVGMDRKDFKRGMLISDRDLGSSSLIDAKLALFSGSHEIGLWTHAIFLMSTFETQARIHLLDKNRMVGGQKGFIQVHLLNECVARAGDRFVIRSTSGDATIGGGEIIDPAPLHHRRRPRELVENLSKMVEAGLPGRIAAEVRKNISGLSAASLAARLNVAESEVVTALQTGMTDDIKTISSPAGAYVIALRSWGMLKEKILSNVRAYHKVNPLISQGRSLKDLVGVIGTTGEKDGEAFTALFLDGLVREGALKQVGPAFALPEHAVSMSKDLQGDTLFVENYFKNCGMQTPVLSDLEKQGAVRGIDGKKMRNILDYLTDNNILRRVEGSYLYTGQVDTCRTKLLGALTARPEGLTVAQFRDVVEGNRKICLLLFALFEKEGIVKRVGDVRIITQKGKDAIPVRTNP
jgi:selenocysteine-specific elongation factor